MITIHANNVEDESNNVKKKVLWINLTVIFSSQKFFAWINEMQKNVY